VKERKEREMMRLNFDDFYTFTPFVLAKADVICYNKPRAQRHNYSLVSSSKGISFSSPYVSASVRGAAFSKIADDKKNNLCAEAAFLLSPRILYPRRHGRDIFYREEFLR
jgi:hypothetical protein